MSSASGFVVLTSGRHIPLFPLHDATVSNERLFPLIDLTILPTSRSYKHLKNSSKLSMSSNILLKLVHFSLVFSTFNIEILIILCVALFKSLCTPEFQL